MSRRDIKARNEQQHHEIEDTEKYPNLPNYYDNVSNITKENGNEVQCKLHQLILRLLVVA
jgi:hypothetical protein